MAEIEVVVMVVVVVVEAVELVFHLAGLDSVTQSGHCLGVVRAGYLPVVGCFIAVELMGYFLEVELMGYFLAVELMGYFLAVELMGYFLEVELMGYFLAVELMGYFLEVVLQSEVTLFHPSEPVLRLRHSVVAVVVVVEHQLEADQSRRFVEQIHRSGGHLLL